MFEALRESGALTLSLVAVVDAGYYARFGFQSDPALVALEGP
jgi:predicted N-acetyltransferase YhbS